MKHLFAMSLALALCIMFCGFQAVTSKEAYPGHEDASKTLPPSGPDSNQNASDAQTDKPLTVNVNLPKESLLDKIIAIVALVCTFAVAVAAIIGICLAVKTLKLLVRQTAASVLAAKAANASTDALINSERAWVVPEFIPNAVLYKDKIWRRQNGTSLEAKDIVAGEHYLYWLKFTNMGKTPAYILDYKVLYTCLPKGVGTLPENAPGDWSSRRECIHLIPGNGGEIEIKDEDHIIDTRSLMEGSRATIASLEETAVFYGWVRYRHMFSSVDDCYADFAYVYQPSAKRLRGIGRYFIQRQERAEARPSVSQV